MTGPVKFSSLVRHAIHALVFLARSENIRRVTAAQVASSISLSGLFLHKAMNGLTKVGIVNSVKGPRGSYCLAKPAKKITLLEVVEAVDGRISSDNSSFGHATGKILTQRIQAFVDRVTEDYRRQLGKVRIADVARR